MTSTDAVWNDHAPALYRKACFQIRVQLVASIAMPVRKGLCQVGARADAGGNEPRCKIGVATQAETDQSYQGRTARRKLIRSFAGPGQQQRQAEALATGNVLKIGVLLIVSWLVSVAGLALSRSPAFCTNASSPNRPKVSRADAHRLLCSPMPEKSAMPSHASSRLPHRWFLRDITALYYVLFSSKV